MRRESPWRCQSTTFHKLPPDAFEKTLIEGLCEKQRRFEERIARLYDEKYGAGSYDLLEEKAPPFVLVGCSDRRLVELLNMDQETRTAERFRVD